jgi:hypothetical protein
MAGTAVGIHFGDKLVPGLNNSVGIQTASKPEVTVRLGGKDLKFVLTRLDTELWKVRFLLPKDAAGEVEISTRAGSETAKEKKAVG